MITKIYEFGSYKESRTKEITKDEFNKLLPKDFGKPCIFRGSRSNNYEYSIVDTNVERESANTENYYTLFINNNPLWSAYPKRKLICSTSSGYAGGFAGYDNNGIFRLPKMVIPTDMSTIFGVCPVPDIWEAFTLRKKHEYKFEKVHGGNEVDMGTIIRLSKLDPGVYNISTDNYVQTSMFMRILRQLKISQSSYDTMMSDLDKLNLIDIVSTILSPDKFQFMDYSSISNSMSNTHTSGTNLMNREVWTDKQCILSNF